MKVCASTDGSEGSTAELQAKEKKQAEMVAGKLTAEAALAKVSGTYELKRSKSYVVRPSHSLSVGTPGLLNSQVAETCTLTFSVSQDNASQGYSMPFPATSAATCYAGDTICPSFRLDVHVLPELLLCMVLPVPHTPPSL